MSRYLYRADDGAEIVQEFAEGARVPPAWVVPIRPPLSCVTAAEAERRVLAGEATLPVFTRKYFDLVGPVP